MEWLSNYKVSDYNEKLEISFRCRVSFTVYLKLMLGRMIGGM